MERRIRTVISTELLNRNLLALSSRESRLSSLLSTVSPPDDLIFRASRNQYPVPVVIRDGREFPLHSLFNPQKEAAKFSLEYPSGGYIIFLGFGCGYHIEPFLKRSSVNGILIIDNNIAQLRSLLSVRDFRKILLDSRVHLLMENSPREVGDYLLSHCFPAVTGDIQVIPLRSRMNLEKEYFTGIFNTVKETLNTLADDFTVQTSFGRKWFSNTLANLEPAEETRAVLPPVKKAVITAAGPSLEENLAAFPVPDEQTLIIATDTSYPALVKRGIRPDLVVSIDCQHVSYHHFLAGYDREIPLVLDLASPQGLARLSSSPFFFTSGHPFSIYINRKWRQFPEIDTSGGNVTHAAVSLASRLGARRITLMGADFCYPSGKSYARGTYIYPYFHSRSGRRSPGEHLFYDFVFRSPQLRRRTFGTETLYATRPLQEYRNRLEETYGSSSGFLQNLSPYAGDGESGLQPSGASEPVRPESPNRESVFFSAGPARCDWRSFLDSYRKDLEALPLPAAPVARYFEHLPGDKRTLWLTLLPAVASVRRSHGHELVDSSLLLAEAYHWTLDMIKKQIQKTTPA